MAKTPVSRDFAAAQVAAVGHAFTGEAAA
jgi:hypothetical protein